MYKLRTDHTESSAAVFVVWRHRVRTSCTDTNKTLLQYFLAVCVLRALPSNKFTCHNTIQEEIKERWKKKEDWEHCEKSDTGQSFLGKVFESESDALSLFQASWTTGLTEHWLEDYLFPFTWSAYEIWHRNNLKLAIPLRLFHFVPSWICGSPLFDKLQYTLICGNSFLGKRPLGIPRYRREVNIKMDLNEIA
jgi:hypothetical protein